MLVFGATVGEREAGGTKVGDEGRGGEDTARDGYWGGGRNVRESKEFRKTHTESILPGGSWPCATCHRKEHVRWRNVACAFGTSWINQALDAVSD
jgi:hypothetical protein